MTVYVSKEVILPVFHCRTKSELFTGGAGDFRINGLLAGMAYEVCVLEVDEWGNQAAPKGEKCGEVITTSNVLTVLAVLLGIASGVIIVLLIVLGFVIKSHRDAQSLPQEAKVRDSRSVSTRTPYIPKKWDDCAPGNHVGYSKEGALRKSADTDTFFYNPSKSSAASQPSGNGSFLHPVAGQRGPFCVTPVSLESDHNFENLDCYSEKPIDIVYANGYLPRSNDTSVDGSNSATTSMISISGRQNLFPNRPVRQFPSMTTLEASNMSVMSLHNLPNKTSAEQNSAIKMAPPYNNRVSYPQQ